MKQKKILLLLKKSPQMVLKSILAELYMQWMRTLSQSGRLKHRDGLRQKDLMSTELR